MTQPDHAGTPPSFGTAVGLAVLASLLWATAIIWVKLGLEDLPPLTFASLRYVVGAAALLAYRVARHGVRPPRLDRTTRRRLVGLGLLLYTFVPAVQFLSIDRVEAVSFNFVFQAGIPLVLAFTAGAILREPTSRWEWAGVAGVVAGVYVFYPALPAGSEAAGLVLAALAAMGIGGSNLIQRRVMRAGAATALDATLVSMLLGSLVLLVISMAAEPFPTLDAGSAILVLVLGVVNTALAFTVWHHAMRSLNALHAGIIASAQIVEVPILAIFVLGEAMTTGRIIGSGIVLAGILVVHFSRAVAKGRAPSASPREVVQPAEA